MGPAVPRPCQAAALPAGSLLRVGLSPGTLSGVDTPTNKLPAAMRERDQPLGPQSCLGPTKSAPLCDLGRKSCLLGGGQPGGCLPGSVRPEPFLRFGELVLV